MLSNQPKDFTNKQNTSQIDDETSLFEGIQAITKLTELFEKNHDPSDYYSQGTSFEKYVKMLNTISNDLKLYPSIGVKIAEYLKSHTSNQNIKYYNITKSIDDIKQIFEINLPEYEYTIEGSLYGNQKKREQLGYDSLLRLKALGPVTSSMKNMAYQTYEMIVKDAGSVSKQSMAVKMDRLSRGKKINLDLRMSNKIDAGYICDAFGEDYSINALRINDIIRDSEFSFACITGREMKSNEFELMVSNLEEYVAKFELIKEETFDNRIEMMNRSQASIGLGTQIMKKQKVEDLVSLVKRCKEFVGKNDIFSKFSEVQDRIFVTHKDGSRSARVMSNENESKSEIVNIIKELNVMIDKCQDFLLEIGDPNFAKNYIKENKGNSNIINQPLNTTNPGNGQIMNNQNNSSQNVTTIPVTEQSSTIQPEIPNFQKTKVSIEKKIETIENIDQFVSKYFKDFDAFLVSDISQAKINDEVVLKFTGQDHTQEGVKDGFAKISIQGLSKFELQTLGKIAEKYNTVEGVQIWIGNGQIGIMNSSGEMLELLS
jgi:hypothetical protein